VVAIAPSASLGVSALPPVSLHQRPFPCGSPRSLCPGRNPNRLCSSRPAKTVSASRPGCCPTATTRAGKRRSHTNCSRSCWLQRISVGRSACRSTSNSSLPLRWAACSQHCLAVPAPVRLGPGRGTGAPRVRLGHRFHRSGREWVWLPGEGPKPSVKIGGFWLGLRRTFHKSIWRLCNDRVGSPI